MFAVELLTIQKSPDKGTGIAVMAIETDSQLSCMFAVAKVKGKWVWDFMYLASIFQAHKHRWRKL